MRQNALLGDIFEIYSINTSTSDAFNKNEKRRDIFICVTVGEITANRAAFTRRGTFYVSQATLS
jgi:hypothetical protein